MFRSLLVGVLIMVSGSTIVAAYCSKPDAPYCATRYGPFSDQYDFDRCKREMQSYQDDLDSYLSCLRRDSEQAIRDYNEAVASFNRRARG
jgi:hypothetical protein